MLYLIIAASLIPGILAVAQYFESDRKDKENKANEIELKSKIDKLTTANSDLAEQLIKLQNDNFNLSQQLTQTSLFLNENIVGINNIDVNIIPCSKTEYHFTFKNNDSLPVLQAKIIIINYNELTKCQVLEIDSEKIVFDDACYMKNLLQLPEINLHAGNHIELPQKKYTHGPKIEYLNFSIRSTTRKSTTVTYYVFKYVENKFEKSFRIYDIINDEEVFRSEDNNLNLKTEYWNKHFYLDKKVFHRVSQ